MSVGQRIRFCRNPARSQILIFIYTRSRSRDISFADNASMMNWHWSMGAVPACMMCRAALIRYSPRFTVYFCCSYSYRFSEDKRNVSLAILISTTKLSLSDSATKTAASSISLLVFFGKLISVCAPVRSLSSAFPQFLVAGVKATHWLWLTVVFLFLMVGLFLIAWSLPPRNRAYNGLSGLPFVRN